MRIAVIYYSDKKRTLLQELSKALAKGFEKQGHSVDVFNARDFNRKLAIYQAVAIGTETTGTFGGKIHRDFSKYLASRGPVLNLKTLAFMCSTGLRRQKSLLTLMRAMEAEGMFVLSSEIIKNPDHAESIAENLMFN